MLAVLVVSVAGSAASDEMLPGTPIQKNEVAPVSGLILTDGEQEELDQILAGMEAQIAILEARLTRALAQSEVEKARAEEQASLVRVCQAQGEVYKARIPGVLERNLGCAVGVGAVADGSNVDAGLALACGWKF